MANTQTLKTIIEAEDRSKPVFEGVMKSVDTVASGMKTIGGAMSTYVTAPIVGAFTLAAKSAMDFQATMGNVSTLIAGDSTVAVKELGDAVLEMTTYLPKSANELGAGLYDVLSAGIKGSANQLNVLQQSARLAIGGLGSTAEGVDIMTSAINAFGLDAKNSTHIADVLFKTTAVGKTTVAGMAQAFGSTAPIIASAGVKLEEFSAAVGAMTASGLPAAQAQNQLRQSVVSLVKPTEDMAKLIKKAGLESGSAAIKQLGLVETMRRLDAAAGSNQSTLAAAWGSVEALGAATSLTTSASQTFTDALASMTTGSDQLSDAVDKQNATWQAQYQIVKNQIGKALIELGNKVMPAVAKVATELGQAISKLAEWFSSLSDAQQQNVIKWLGIIAAVGPALVVIGTVIEKVRLLGGAFLSIAKVIVTAVRAITAAVASNPIILVIVAIIAAIVLLVTHWDWVKQKTIEAWNAITSAVSNAWNSMKTTWNDGVAAVKQYFTDLGASIVQKVTEIKQGFADFIQAVADTWNNLPYLIGYAIGAAYQAIVNFFTVTIPQAWSAFKANWVAFWDGVGNYLSNLPERIGHWFSETWNTIGNWWESMKTTTAQKTSELVNNTVSFFSNLPGRIAGAVSNLWSTVSTAWDNFKKAFLDAANAVIDSIVGVFTGLPDRVANAFKTGVNNVKGFISDFVSGFTKGRDAEKRATGGEVDAGQQYWVGETGQRELFVPNRSGKILNQQQIAQQVGGGGGITIGTMENHIHNEVDMESVFRSLSFKLATAR